MLIDFRVENYTCFKDTSDFSLQATSIKELQEFNTFKYDNLGLLKSAVLYGANASGKSNYLQAMRQMMYLVLNSSKEILAGEPLPIEVFQLDTKSVHQPALFEIRFIQNDIVYRFGFKATREKITHEWLYSRKRPTTKEAELFTRDGQDIKIGPQFKEGKQLKSITRPNALFLSVSAQFNGEIATKLLEWFKSFNLISGLKDDYARFTLNKVAGDETFKNRVLNILTMADVGIKDLSVKETVLNKEEIPERIKKKINNINELKKIAQIELLTSHTQYDAHKQETQTVNFNLDLQESQGTQKLFALAGPILDSLDYGKILIIDEFESRLHPNLQKLIIDLFHSPRFNKTNAQLIIATQNTRLLSEDMFRRDQIWFVEKDQYGVSNLYSLYDFKDKGKIRKDESFEKNYLLGKYGAVPNLTELDLEG